MFQNNIWNFFKLHKAAIMLASENGYTEIAKLFH